MTNSFETSAENLEPRDDKKCLLLPPRKSRTRKATKKDDSNSSVVESCEESLIKHRPAVKKYCTLYGKYSHTADKCKDLKDLVHKHKQKMKNFELYIQDKIVQIARIKKKFLKYVKKKLEKVQRFHALRTSYDESKNKSDSIVGECIESGEILSFNFE